MKVRSVLAVLLFLTGLQSALAQMFTVRLANKKVVRYRVAEVDSIVFSELDDHVDLGLPSGTLWATCNVGASKPEEYGECFAWAETTGKTNYNWSTYKYCHPIYVAMTKYCVSSASDYATIDYRIELEAMDDAAKANEGDHMQIPSLEQCKELINSNYTTTTWTTLNGVYGRKITSKKNGNSIFFPAAGFRREKSLYDAGSDGYYWSRSLYTNHSAVAYYLHFSSSSIGMSANYYRFHGFFVRPVRVKKVPTIPVTSIELNQTEVSVKVGETLQLLATVLPMNATNKNVKWASSNANVATVDETGKVVAVAVGTCTITGSATDGSGVKVACQVKVQPIAVTSIELNSTEDSVKVGETLQLSATVLPENATNKNVKWVSSNANVATVDQSGKVTSVAVGTCTITCSAADGSGVKVGCQVKVLPITVTSIELNQTEVYFKVGETTQLMATVLPKNATNKAVVWASSIADVATVDQTGKVTAISVGNSNTCTITCSATDGSGVKAECQVIIWRDNSGVIDGKAYVDLGLPSGTLWATCNVGASSLEEYGDYFAWGETEPKSDYTWSTYKYCKGSDNTMTKYCTSSEYGTVDNKTELEAADDAATVNWGSGWQMPSREQIKELFNSSYTTTTRTLLNGVYGRKITSKSNGNSIFLPPAGFRREKSLYFAGELYAYFWSRSLNASHSGGAYVLYFNPHDGTDDSNGRYYGYSVRPVRVIAVSNIELSQTVLPVMVGETSQLSATVLPDNASNKDIKWESSNADVATVDQSGKVSAVAVGDCIITCSATDGSGVKAECQVTVSEFHEYIDLGLPSGTLWATCNVGASKPEEYGDYFAWGETTTKGTYNWSTYKYCKGTENTMTKYCISSTYGTVDNKTELEPSDDAATANWGSSWQMPSLEQVMELYNSSYTTTTWTTMNGVYGRKITSKSNGNSIFLPAAGYRDDTSLYNAGSYGHYWSRSLTTSISFFAYELYFDSSYVDTLGGRCYFGHSVRPVRVKN